MTIELGCKARDRISEWEGIVTARYAYLNGCVRYEISGADKDGKPEGFIFDEQQIEVLSTPVPELLGLPGPLPQHPQPEPSRANRGGGPRGTKPVPR